MTRHTRRSIRLTACMALVLLALQAGDVDAQAEPPAPRFAGKPLSAALLELQDLGLRIVFTSEVVRPDMTVEVEPTATDPRQILEELLAPHGLEARDGPRGSVFVARSPGMVGPSTAITGSVR